ncbi:MAG: response regulator [Armatimonadota bacterium]
MTNPYDSAPPMMPSDTRTVLLVEDEPDIRNLLALVLADAGYVVTTAATGAEALTILAETPYALVVTDYHLPDMTGAAVAQAAHQCVPPPKVLLMSGSPDIKGHATAIGADAWFRKGEPLARLLTLITRLLEERP